MKRAIRILTVTLILSLLLGMVPAMAAQPENLKDKEWEVLLLTNRERLKEGLTPLTTTDFLQAGCDIRAEETSVSFSHTRPDGSSCWTVMEEVGAPKHSAMGENIAWGQYTPKSALTAWMNSDGHRANILNSSFVHMGAGHFKGGSHNYDYWVQFFFTGQSCSYQGMKLLLPASMEFDAGTSIDEMGITAQLRCSSCGDCYLPIMAEFCTGYDPNAIGEQTVTVKCLGYTKSMTVKINKVESHEHSYTPVVTAPTCTEEGYTTYTCSCGDSYVTGYVNALGHEYQRINEKEPTCSEPGYTGDTICTRCGELLGSGVSIGATGHDYAHWDTEPTCTQEGYTTYLCIWCSYSHNEEYVPALGHDYEDGYCSRCGQRDPSAPEGPCDGGVNCPSRQFRDVDVRQWYHPGIDFALNRGMMNGVGQGKFEPDSSMTRAMLVTVLWRYAGSPVEGVNLFSDVPNGQWYTQAVAWAAANGIVTGTSATTFSPEGNITREQMAAILYRYASKEGFDTSKEADLGVFPDGNKVSGYAREALSWANAEGLITGSKIGNNTYLDPQGNATRAQVATILMRFIENIAEK